MLNEKQQIELLKMLGYKEGEEVEIESDGNTINIEGFDYIILDDEEINERMLYYIQETASYFNTWFLSKMTNLPEIVFEKLVDENEAVFEIINHTCGIDTFIENAIETDGIGNFLNGYNGEAYELSNGLTVINN